MAKDFKASQIRTTQIIASGSITGKPSLAVLSASSVGVDFDGSGISSIPAAVGKDVFLFVSGSTTSKNSLTDRGATLFGGDIMVSGTAYGPAGAFAVVAGSDKQVQFNDGGTALGANSGFIYDKTSQALSAGNLYVTGTSTSVRISGSVVIAQDLTVNGTTTTINTTNLVVKDPLIYFGSGTTSPDQNGGIALASGSSTANQALVWGRVASDTWGAGTKDVTAGTTTDLTGMTLAPIRASRLELGGTGAIISSSNGQDIGLNNIGNVSVNNDLYVGRNLFVSGNTRIGNASNDSLQVTAKAWFDDELNASGSVTIAQNLAVNGGFLTSTAVSFDLLNSNVVNLNVGSNATAIEIGSSLGTTSINNSLTVDGNTTLGDASTDSLQVVANAWFDNSLRVSGSSWVNNSLNVSGSTKLGNAASNTVQITGNSWFDNSLNVSGSTKLGNSAANGVQVAGNAWFDNNLNVSGNVRVGDASTDSMQITSNAWFDNGLRVSGSSWVNNNLSVSGSTKLGNAASNTVQITGNSWFDNSLNVSGSTRLGNAASNTVQVAGNSWFDNSLNVSGSTRLGNAAANTVQIAGNTWLDNNLNVSGNVRIGDASTDSMQVTSNAWFDNGLRVTGSVWINSNLNVTGSTKLGNAASNTVQITGNSWFDNSLNVSGSTRLGNAASNTVQVAGNSWFDNSLNVSGSTKLGSTSLNSVQIAGNTWFDNNVNVSGSLLVAGNLEVRGMVTGSVFVVTATNMTVADQVIYLASGSKVSNTDGGIAITSGSSVTNQALVWGRVSTDTWGAGRQDVTSGTTTDLTGMTLVPVRASRFEVGGGSVMLLNGSDQYTGRLVASTGLLVDPGSSGQGLRLGNYQVPIGLTGSNVRVGMPTTEFGSELPPQPGIDSYFFVSGSKGSKDTSVRGVSVFGGDVVISGTLHGGSPLKVSGSMALSGSLRLQTQDSAPVVGSNEAVLYVLNDAGTKKLYWQNSDGAGSGQQIGAGGSASGSFNEVNAGGAISLVTTASVSVAGSKGITYGVNQLGSDVFFFVSGSSGSKGTLTRGVAVFSGDAVISGALYNGSGTPYVTGAAGSDTYLQFNNNGSFGSDSNLSWNNTTKVLSSKHITIPLGGVLTGSKHLPGPFYNLLLGADRLGSSKVIITNRTAIDTAGSETSSGFGSDVFFVVSGSVGSAGTSTKGTSLFGGDVVVSGSTYSSAFSGSLTKLTDGTSYLIAGTNVTITTGSSGAVTISSTGGVLTGSFNEVNSGGTISMVTTASVSIAGSNGFNYGVDQVGTDTFFFVNGTSGAKGSGTRGVAVFGGDALVSGALYGASSLVIAGNTRITGSLMHGFLLSAGGGNGAHAQGIGSSAEGSYSHAEGYFTTTRGLYSHAEGGGTIASGTYQLAAGKYNKRNNTDSLLVVGNGSGDADSVRSDIFLVNTGTVLVGSASLGADTFFFVSGSTGSKNTSTIGTSVFGGDVVVSGTIYNGAGVAYSTGGGGGGSGTGFNDGGNKLNVTSSVAFAGSSQGSSYYASSVGADAYFFVSGSTTTKDTSTRGTAVFGGDLMISGSTYVASGSAVYPVVDRGSDLGSPAKRWGNIYTGDLHLRNDRGDWTIVEEEDYLCVVNNKTGKKFKMALIPIEE